MREECRGAVRTGLFAQEPTILLQESRIPELQALEGLGRGSGKKLHVEVLFASRPSVLSTPHTQGR